MVRKRLLEPGNAPGDDAPATATPTSKSETAELGTAS
jgi:hypothetical protein